MRSPTGQPRSTWQVRLQVGPVDKRLIVRGPGSFVGNCSVAGGSLTPHR
ncbi:hypothetical protein OM794_21400 [Halomonas sp. BDJS001]|nr:hypothetical protein [Halomonas sp. BDJS001]UZH09850.1 hypothetical protein OM794_21400 [Halomonas sp. BDJS001]